MTLRQTPAIAEPSHGLLQPSVHQKLNLPQCSIQHSALKNEQSSSSCQNHSSPNPSHSRLYQGNIQPQSIQHSSAARFTNPQSSPLTSTHLNTDPRHRSLLHTYPLSNPIPTKHPHKAPHSTPQTPHPNVQQQRAGQLQPQINSSCNSALSGCKEVELKM